MPTACRNNKKSNGLSADSPFVFIISVEAKSSLQNTFFVLTLQVKNGKMNYFYFGKEK